jgi:hypothetical protein
MAGALPRTRRADRDVAAETTTRHPMADTPQGPQNDDQQTQRAIDEVFGTANPNPERVGCLTTEELKALAERRLPIGAPGYEHLAKCSPCYREFRTLQNSRSQSHHHLGGKQE